MDTWRSDVFFSVGEAATSKWTHGDLKDYVQVKKVQSSLEIKF